MRLVLLLLFTLFTFSENQTILANLPDESVYHIPVNLVDSRGKEVSLDELAGQPIVISMFFTSCISVCPVIAHDLLRLREEAASLGLKDYSLVMVSIDAENDDPQKLRAFAVRNAFTTAQIKLFSAKTAGDAKSLSQTLSLPFRKQKDGSWGHVSGLILLNKYGEMVTREDQLGADMSRLAKSLANTIGDNK